MSLTGGDGGAEAYMTVPAAAVTTALGGVAEAVTCGGDEVYDSPSCS